MTEPCPGEPSEGEGRGRGGREGREGGKGGACASSDAPEVAKWTFIVFHPLPSRYYLPSHVHPIAYISGCAGAGGDGVVCGYGGSAGTGGGPGWPASRGKLGLPAARGLLPSGESRGAAPGGEDASASGTDRQVKRPARARSPPFLPGCRPTPPPLPPRGAGALSAAGPAALRGRAGGSRRPGGGRPTKLPGETRRGAAPPPPQPPAEQRSGAGSRPKASGSGGEAASPAAAGCRSPWRWPRPPAPLPRAGREDGQRRGKAGVACPAVPRPSRRSCPQPRRGAPQRVAGGGGENEGRDGTGRLARCAAAAAPRQRTSGKVVAPLAPGERGSAPSAGAHGAGAGGWWPRRGSPSPLRGRAAHPREPRERGGRGG